MRIGDTLRRAAEVFVDLDDEEGDAPKELDLSAEAEAASVSTAPVQTAASTTRVVVTPEKLAAEHAPSPSVASAPTTSPAPQRISTSALAPDQPVDYSAIYKDADVPAVAFTAEQFEELVASLPAGLPAEALQQTVRISLTAMGKSIGVTPESIMADANAKSAALAAYSENVSRKLEAYLTAANTEIVNMEKAIQEKREAISNAQSRFAQIQTLCSSRVQQLGGVAKFFESATPTPPASTQASTEPKQS